MRSILTGKTWNISINTQVRGKIFQILGFYVILYNISNFSFGVNFPFHESVHKLKPREKSSTTAHFSVTMLTL